MMIALSIVARREGRRGATDATSESRRVEQRHRRRLGEWRSRIVHDVEGDTRLDRGRVVFDRDAGMSTGETHDVGDGSAHVARAEAERAERGELVAAGDDDDALKFRPEPGQRRHSTRMEVRTHRASRGGHQEVDQQPRKRTEGVSAYSISIAGRRTLPRKRARESLTLTMMRSPLSMTCMGGDGELVVYILGPRETGCEVSDGPIGTERDSPLEEYRTRSSYASRSVRRADRRRNRGETLCMRGRRV